MAWKPSYGLLRAHGIVCSLAAEAEANGHQLSGVFQHHMTSVLGDALDDARMDGTLDAMNARAGGMAPWPKRPDGSVDVEKATEPWGEFEHEVRIPPGGAIPFTLPHKNGSGVVSYGALSTGSHTNVHADPVVEAREEGPAAVALQTPAQVQAWADNIASALPTETEQAPKKRRGRPPGAKGKKAKAMAAKAKKDAAPVVVPDPTGVADLVVEPSEAPTQ